MKFQSFKTLCEKSWGIMCLKRQEGVPARSPFPGILLFISTLKPLQSHEGEPYFPSCKWCSVPVGPGLCWALLHMSFNPHCTLGNKDWVPFVSQGNQGSEELSNQPKVLQLVIVMPGGTQSHSLTPRLVVPFTSDPLCVYNLLDNFGLYIYKKFLKELIESA